MANTADMAMLAAVGAGAYVVGTSGGARSPQQDFGELGDVLGSLPGKADSAGATASDIAAIADAIGSASETAPQIIRVGSEASDTSSDLLNQIHGLKEEVRREAEERTNPPRGESGEGNSESPGSGGVDSGSGGTVLDTSQSDSYDLQDEPGTGPVSTAARTTGEAGASLGSAVDDTVGTLSKTGNTIAQSVKAATGNTYDTTGTFAEGSGGGSTKRIYQGSVVGGTGDAIAGVADDLAGSTDEAVGRATEAAKKGDIAGVASNLTGGFL